MAQNIISKRRNLFFYFFILFYFIFNFTKDKIYKTYLEREKKEDEMMNKKYLTYKLKKY
jgi:hypothetical protein